MTTIYELREENGTYPVLKPYLRYSTWRYETLVLDSTLITDCAEKWLLRNVCDVYGHNTGYFKTVAEAYEYIERPSNRPYTDWYPETERIDVLYYYLQSWEVADEVADRLCWDARNKKWIFATKDDEYESMDRARDLGTDIICDEQRVVCPYYDYSEFVDMVNGALEGWGCYKFDEEIPAGLTADLDESHCWVNDDDVNENEWHCWARSDDSLYRINLGYYGLSLDLAQRDISGYRLSPCYARLARGEDTRSLRSILVQRDGTVVGIIYNRNVNQIASVEDLEHRLPLETFDNIKLIVGEAVDNGNKML